MRHRTLILLLSVACVSMLAACDVTGLPPTPTTAPTVTSVSSERATPTSETSARRPSPSPRATRTAGPDVARRTATARVTGTAVAEVDPTEEATPGISEDVTEAIAEVQADVAQLRGLQPKEDVVENFITKEQLGRNMLDDIEGDYPQEEARLDALELWLLRLLDKRDTDLRQLYIDLFTEAAAGYYDPDKDEMFILQEAGKDFGPQQRETMAHEFVHSLQDQHYDMDKLLPEETTDEDAFLAHFALIEGDATISGLMYAYNYFSEEEFAELVEGSGDQSSQDAVNRLPRYIRDGFFFRYDDGVKFVSQLIERGGFSKVNEAFSDPPMSSEQIMHPDKYLSVPRDDPMTIALPPLTDTLGTGWNQKDGATFGEFDLKIMLEENGLLAGGGTPTPDPDEDVMNDEPKTESDRAAAGWGGGMYALYENGDSALVILGTRWDTDKDADEFDAALRKTFAQSKREGTMWSDGGRYFGIKSEGDAVTLIAATDLKTVESALSAIK